MRKLHLPSLSLCVALALVVAGCSSDKAVAPNTPGGTSPPSAGVATITVSPSNAIIAMGSVRTLTAQAKDAAGNNVTARLAWQTSNSSVATVDSSGKVIPVAEGTADITASSGSVKSSAVSVTVTDNTPWPTGDAPSGQLIETALQQGKLTEEQALIYEVYTAFMDSRLPKEYRGAPEAGIENPILKIAAERYPTLSPAAKAALAPFFIDPAYEGSWFQARFGTNPGDGSAMRSNVAASQSGVAVTPEECRAQLDARGWKTKTTAHFAIHYGYSLFPYAGRIGEEINKAAARTADIVVVEAEKIWERETSTFGRVPMSDANVSDNGCDGLLDIWIYNILDFAIQNRKDVQAMAVPYLEGACKTPARIHLIGEGDSTKTRNALAHEFFHVLEMGSFTRSNCLKEYFWLGEATGNWAMDLVYPDDQYEHAYAAAYVQTERFVPVDQPGEAGEGANGYTDYVFLLYLARRYGNSAIRDIWDATESGSSVDAIVKALDSRGGIQSVWPEFALALWNDYEAGNQDSFYKWDKLKWGMKKAFDDRDVGGKWGKPSVQVDLEAGPRKTFQTLTSTTGSATGRQLPRLSIHADYLKFTDEKVASVLYSNALALDFLPNLKIQALIKKGGTWKAEDWTKEKFKSFCRDVRDERIEELVLIYSNSDGDKAGPPIQFSSAPRVSVSNVGCAKWVGTSSIEGGLFVGWQGLTTAENVVFERLRYLQGGRHPEVPYDVPGMETFWNTSAHITASFSSPCRSSTDQGGGTGAGSGEAGEQDGMLQINLDNLIIGTTSPPPDRDVLKGGGLSWLVTTVTRCDETTVTYAPYPVSFGWLAIPPGFGFKVSGDGRTIEGNVSETLEGITLIKKWKFTAVREP